MSQYHAYKDVWTLFVGDMQFTLWQCQTATKTGIDWHPQFTVRF